MISTIFLDLDETLVQSFAATKILFENMADSYLGNKFLGDNLWQSFLKHGRESLQMLSQKEYLYKIQCGSYDMFFSNFTSNSPEIIDLRNEAHEYQKIVMTGIANDFNISDLSVIHSIQQFLMKKWLTYYSVFPDVFTFLNTFKEYKIYILTNGFHDVQMKKLIHCGLSEYSDKCFISADFGIGKPDLTYFKHVLDLTNTSAGSAVMIGDSISADIAGAKNAGIMTFYINRDKEKVTEQNALPDMAVESLTEVSDMFNY